MTDSTGRRTLVVGGTKGIGRAVVEDFVASGDRVAVIGRDEVALKELGDGVLGLVADITDDAAVAAAFEKVHNAWGGLDVAVNTAGVFSPPAPAGDLEPAELERTLRINVVGTQRVMRHEIALMREGGGAIVNFSSNVGAHRTYAGLAAYGASKAAVSALTRAAALDHVRDGIRINAVSPGPSDTTMSMRPGESEDDRAERVAGTNPAGRVARLSEIVAAVRYLVSDDAAYAVGTDLVVDGGVSA